MLTVMRTVAARGRLVTWPPLEKTVQALRLQECQDGLHQRRPAQVGEAQSIFVSQVAVDPAVAVVV